MLTLGAGEQQPQSDDPNGRCVTLLTGPSQQGLVAPRNNDAGCAPIKILELAPKSMDWFGAFSELPSSELDKLAILRVVECTNGVIQNLFREGNPDALSVDETRVAMKFSMSCIKNMAIPLGDNTVTFSEQTSILFNEIRRLYISGAKNNNPADWAEFLRASEANLRAIGSERIEIAKREIFYNIYELPPHTLDWGIDYIKGFVAANA